MKKFIISSLVVVVLATAAASPALALTAADLQTQIQQLQAQLTQLLAQQNNAATVPSACVGITFNRNLSRSMSGNDVKCLQASLNQLNVNVANIGAGSPGNETTFFGGATRAAVIRFQTLYSISPAVGFVGPITRAKLNLLLSGGVVPPGPTTTPTPTPSATPTPVAGGLSVGLDSSTPVAATVIADTTSGDGAQGLASALKIRFTSEAGKTVKVTSLKLKRSEISSDTDLSNVYLFDGSTQIADVPAVASTYFTFTNSAGLFTVSGEKVITVKFDLANGTSSGKTIRLSVNASGDVTSDATAITGVFPISGNMMTTATVSDLGKLTLATYSDPGSAIDPANDLELWKFKLTASDQKIRVTQIKLTVIGTLSAGDFANLYLTDGTTQLGAKASSLASDKTVTFDLSGSPYVMTAGIIKYISVKGDIVGGSSRTFKFQVRNAGDAVAIDDNYGVNLKVNQTDTFSIVTAATETTISAGSLQINKATDAPTGNVAQGALNVKLAKFTVKAIGEGIKVSSMNINITGNATLSTLDLNNGKILLDGVQIGTTKDLDTNGATATATEFTFGNQFVVNANQTKILEIYADIQSGAAGTLPAGHAGTTILADLAVGSSNAIKLTSGNSYNTPATTGNTLTVVSGALTTSKNTGLASLTTIANTQAVKIGSWVITAGNAEGVNITSFKVVDRNTGNTANGSQGLGSAFNNMILKNSTTQLGQIITAPSSTAGTEQTFSINSFPVAAGQSAVFDLYADIISGAAWTTGDTVLATEVIGIGMVSGSSVTDSTGANGQGITLGTPTLTVATAASPTNPASTLLVTGKTGVTLGAWTFRASNVEDLKVTRINVKEIDSADKPGAVKNLKLYDVNNASSVGKVNAMTDSTTNTAAFENSAGLFTIPKGTTVTVVLKADINAANQIFTASTQTNGATVQFRISNVATQTSTTDISAQGTPSGTFATGSAGTDYDANQMKVVKTLPVFAKVSVPSGTSLNVGSAVEVARFSITADPAFQVNFNGATNANNIRFTIDTSETGTVARNFQLRDVETDTDVATDVSQTVVAGNTISFSTGLDITVPAGTTKIYKVLAATNDFTAATTAKTLSLKIENAIGDLSWNDGSGDDSTAVVDISDAFLGKGLPTYLDTMITPS